MRPAVQPTARLCCVLVALAVTASVVWPTRSAAEDGEGESTTHTGYPASVRHAPFRRIPRARLELPAGPAATRAGARVLARLERIRRELRVTRYQHRTRVRAARGEYLWDCSGMANWILQRDARRAFRGLRRERAVARTYHNTIARSPTSDDQQRRGWRRLPHIEDAGPGDLLAWLRPSDWPRGNTGHVAFLLSRPVRVPEWPGAYLVRIADSTRLPHQDDTRQSAEGGYGEGTLLITTDGHGRGTGYGWHGRRSRYWIATGVEFGRLVR